MNKGIGLFVGMTALFAMGSVHAACPGTQVMVYTDINDATGHVFEVYKASGISWVDAADCADNISVGGATGHLATITSFSENQWVVDQLLIPALTADPALQSQVWVGGYQDSVVNEPAGGWRWANSEGPFSGSNGNPDYTNWADNEPNNNGGGEDHLTVGRYADDLHAWNDEGSAPGTIGGFIVEYDVPRAAACTGLDCQTIDGQTGIPDGIIHIDGHDQVHGLRVHGSARRPRRKVQVKPGAADVVHGCRCIRVRCAAEDSGVFVRFAQVCRCQGGLRGSLDIQVL